MHAKKFGYTILMTLVITALLLGACGPAATTVAPTSVSPSAVPPTTVPPTTVPPTAVPPTNTPLPPTNTPEPKPEGTLTIALTSDIAGITLSNAPENQAGLAASAIFDFWYFQDPTTGAYTPGMVETCTASADFKVFTVKLRAGITFSNGEPVNSDAVLYTYNLLSNTDKVKIAYPLPGPDVVTLKKIDDLTFEMTKPDPYPTWCTTAPSDILPPKYTEEVGIDAYLAKPIGMGAFIVDEWVRGSHLSLHANPTYWQKGYPKVANLIFKFIPDSSTRIAAIKTGEVDVIGRLTFEETQALAGEANIKVIEHPLSRVYYVAFNNLTTGIDTPIMKKEVRQALNYAVDKQAIIDSLFAGKGSIPTGLVLPGEIGWDANLQPYPYDPVKAKELLTAAGYPDGFEIGFACPDAAYSHINEVCQAVAAYLEAVGVTFTGGSVEFMETGKFWDLEGAVGGSQLPPLFIDSWSGGGKPMSRIGGCCSKDGAYRNWGDPVTQALIDNINSVSLLDPKILGYYAELQKIMLDDPPFIYLYQPFGFEAANTKVNDLLYYPGLEYYDVWRVSVTQ